MFEIGENNQFDQTKTRYSLEVLKNELERGTEEKINKKTIGNSLNIIDSSDQEIKEILHYIIKNKENFKQLKYILIPEKFVMKDNLTFHEENLPIMLHVMEALQKISIKTNTGMEIPRPPKSL